MTQAQVFNLLMCALHDPQFIRDLRMDIPGEIRFTYFEGKVFRVECEGLRVEEVEAGLVGNTFISRLISQLLKKQQQLSENGK